METTTATTQVEKFKTVRLKLDLRFSNVLDHPNIPEELCKRFVKELIENNTSRDSKILVVDSSPNLVLHLKENGFTNLTLAYNSEAKDIKKQKHSWSTLVEGFCAKQEIDVLTFNSKRLNMTEFDVILGNPPFQSGVHKSTTNSLWKAFVKEATSKSEYVSLVLPDIALAPPTFSKYKDIITDVNLDIRKFFPGVGSGFCQIVFQKNPGSVLTIHTAKNNFKQPIGSLDCVPKGFDEGTVKRITSFLTGEREWFSTSEYESRKKIFCEDGEYEVFHTTRNGVWRTNVHHPNNDLIRVSVDASGYPRFRVNRNRGLTQCNYWTIFETMEEAQEYANWGNSKETQAFLEEMKWGGMNAHKIIKNLK